MGWIGLVACTGRREMHIQFLVGKPEWRKGHGEPWWNDIDRRKSKNSCKSGKHSDEQPINIALLHICFRRLLQHVLTILHIDSFLKRLLHFISRDNATMACMHTVNCHVTIVVSCTWQNTRFRCSVANCHCARNCSQVKCYSMLRHASGVMARLSAVC
jgi:hypothetical protein